MQWLEGDADRAAGVDDIAGAEEMEGIRRGWGRLTTFQERPEP